MTEATVYLKPLYDPRTFSWVARCPFCNLVGYQITKEAVDMGAPVAQVVAHRCKGKPA